MTYTCKFCKYGYDRSPDGKKGPSGTVWCGKRKIFMGQNRNMSCFLPIISVDVTRCQDCKWAKTRMPSGEQASIGHIWCRRRNTEISRMRTMECFE